MDLSEQPAGKTFLRHPWELAKRHLLLRFARAFALDARPACILDAGAGDGWMGVELLQTLPAGSRLISWDVHYDAPSAPSDRQRCTPMLGDGDLGDVLLLLDVLEHVDDPRAWLTALVSAHLAPGGYAIVSVPAWPFLYGRHDRALKHHCRFHPAKARHLIEEAGLNVIFGGGMFLSLLPVRCLGNAMDRLLKPGSDAPLPAQLDWRWGRFAQRVATGMLVLDGRLALALARHRMRVPGLSWWALCQKK